MKAFQYAMYPALLVIGLVAGVVLQKEFGIAAPKEVVLGYPADQVNEIQRAAFDYGFSSAFVACRNGGLLENAGAKQAIRDTCFATYMGIMRVE